MWQLPYQLCLVTYLDLLSTLFGKVAGNLMCFIALSMLCFFFLCCLHAHLDAAVLAVAVALLPLLGQQHVGHFCMSSCGMHIFSARFLPTTS
jgi:hypothetical protein